MQITGDLNDEYLIMYMISRHVYKKIAILALNINLKEHKHSLLTSYTPFESPTIQLSANLLILSK